MKIPCETIVRFSNLLPRPTAEDMDPVFRTLRFENGLLIATNRRFLAVEKIAPFEGVFHISVPDDFLEQCRTEAQYSGFAEITATPALNHALAKTTMGFVTGNIGVFPPPGNAFDKWRAVTADACRESATKPNGGILLSTDLLVDLAAASPSGKLVLEEVVDTNRPTVARDIANYDWCGFFYPRISDGKHYPPATLPGWLK